MAQGIVQKLIGDPKRGVRNGFIRPTTPTGAAIGGAKDLFFNGAQVVSLGEDEAPLAEGEVVSYRHTQPLNRGVGTAAVRPLAVDIARIERAPQDDEPEQSANTATRAAGGGQAAGPSVEEQLRASDIYRAI